MNEPEARLSYEDLFRRVIREDLAAGPNPYGYQKRLALSEGLPDVVDVPTGCGKTLAVILGWLYRRRFHGDPQVRLTTPRRLVYCLPMRVLVEQTIAVARQSIDRLSDLLAPDVPSVHRLMGGDSDDYWVRGPELDAILVGTQDMLLSRALNRGYGLNRFRWPQSFGLINNDALWVFDEIQLMGSGLPSSCQLAALRRSQGTYGPSHSMWMSATLDLRMLSTVDHPSPSRGSVLKLDEADRADESLRVRLEAPKAVRRSTVALRKSADTDLRKYAEALAAEIVEQHQRQSLTLIVVNTVDRAVRIWSSLREQRNPRQWKRRKNAEVADIPDPILVHSRFRPADRQRMVDELTSPVPPGGRIVVATQVVEAGVDISARTLFTELAPWPSLVQRFGRCNRNGEFLEPGVASIIWIDVSGEDERLALPYTLSELVQARRYLSALNDARPAALPTVELEPETWHVPRRRDLLDLFDTSADLSGADIDVSRFVRDTDDRSLQVLWREPDSTGWTGGPPPELPRPRREELCSVPVGELREFLVATRMERSRNGWVWDHLEGRWRVADPAVLRPGLVVLLRADLGGYAVEQGWSGSLRDSVPLDKETPGLEPEQGAEDEPGTFAIGRWVDLTTHLSDVGREARAVGRALEYVLDTPELIDVLELAGRWHDVGKAHPAFQHMLVSRLEGDERSRRLATLWAKSAQKSSPGYARPRRYEGECIRPRFRHELASALALMAHEAAVIGRFEEPWRSVALFLVASHHGQVRLAIRAVDGETVPGDTSIRFARGVWDGDRLSSVDLGNGTTVSETILTLAPMELGLDGHDSPSWTDRMVRAREVLGPFRLAFLEALLVAADWRASAAEATPQENSG